MRLGELVAEYVHKRYSMVGVQSLHSDAVGGRSDMA
jgi:hypothetical protein